MGRLNVAVENAKVTAIIKKLKANITIKGKIPSRVFLYLNWRFVT